MHRVAKISWHVYVKIVPTQLTTYDSTELSGVFKATADWNGKKAK